MMKRCKPADLIVFPALTLWAFLISRGVHISWPFRDDLSVWLDFTQRSFRDFVFPAHSGYLRPVFNLAVWAELSLIGKNLQLAVWINLFLLSATAFYLYLFLKKLAGSRGTAFLLSLMFVSSRFSYYNVTQILGLMEALALLLTLAMCRLLYEFAKGGRPRSYELASFFCLLAALTHERYMVLFPMLFYAALLRQLRFGLSGPAVFRQEGLPASGTEKKRFLLFRTLEAAGLFGLLQLLRYRVIGTLLPAGTGGTQVAEAFSGRTFIKNVLSQIAYLFGINAGPVHLNGMPWSETPVPVKLCAILFTALIIRVIMLFFRSFRKGTAEEKGAAQENGTAPALVTAWSDLLLFAGFIIGCVAASSVTVRVEMRWIYVSFGICCMILAYLHGTVLRRCGGTETGQSPEQARVRRVETVSLLTGLACLLMTGCDLYYRANSRDLYLFEEQNRRESLLEKTWGAFGEEIYGMKIYILGNFFELTEFEKENFFQPSGMLPAALPIEHIGSEEEIPAGETGYIVLMENPVTDTYEYAAFVPAEKQAEKQP